nr:MAG TPA: Protein involved in gliding motility 9 Secretion System Type.5A [Caudoviricetes sp.]
MSEDEFWMMDPFMFYDMVEYHNKLERSKYGK